MMKTIWLSHILSEETPLYGGAANLYIQKEKSISLGDSCNTSYLRIPSHSGTHVDTPRHFIKDGKTIESFAANEWIFNRPLILNIEIRPGQLIEPIHVSAYDIIEQADILIFKTGFEKFRGEDIYWQQNPGIAPELAEILNLKCPNLRAIGMDFISISSLKHKEKGKMAHKVFLERGMLIFEDMRLCELQSYTRLEKIIALPLRFQNGDGAPVSIIGMIIDDTQV